MAFYNDIIADLFKNATDENPVTQEQIDQALNEAFPLHSVPKETLLNAQTELKTAKATITTLESQVQDNEQVTTTLADYKAKVEGYEKAEKERTIKERVNGVITANGGTDADYIGFLLKQKGLDLETVSTPDLEGHIKQIKEEKANLFAPATDPADPNKGTQPNGYKPIDNQLNPGQQPNADEALKASIAKAMGIKEPTKQ